MSDATRPTVSIMLDKERHLLLDFNALAEMERVTGKSVLQEATWDDISATDIRALIWAGLLHEEPDLTLEQVGAMLHPGMVNDVVGPLREALDVILSGEQEAASGSPQAETDEEPDPAPLATQTPG